MKKIAYVLLLVNVAFLVCFAQFKIPELAYVWIAFNLLGLVVLVALNLMLKGKRKSNYINDLVKWHKKQKQKKPAMAKLVVCSKCGKERPKDSTSRKCVVCGSAYVTMVVKKKKRGRKNAKKNA